MTDPVERRLRAQDISSGRPHPGRAGEEVAPLPDVVLVEDDLELAYMLRFAFEAAGHRVTMYASGPSALRGLLAMPTTGPRHVVVLADDLPGMDGHTLHEQLQQARPDRFLVAFLTVRVSDADHIRALRGGAVDYMVKPISIPVLLAKLDVWLKRCVQP